MIKTMTALLAGAALLAMGAGAASAATYVSNLEYQGASGPFSPVFGVVTLTELGDGKTIAVNVHLTSPLTLIINTGSKEPFTFSTFGAVDVDLDDAYTHVDAASGLTYRDYYDGGRGSWTNTPFGTFTNRINCCEVVEVDKGKHGDPDTYHIAEEQGGGHGRPGDLNFTVFDAAGLTFAGAGAVIDAGTGRVVTPGTGTDNHFFSNGGGWWFAADINDSGTGNTYAVAAKDAFGPLGCTADCGPPDPCLGANPPPSCGGGGQGGVPEPATWALMIMGFGGVGALMRRRRSVFG
jgi:hypothetical protein